MTTEIAPDAPCAAASKSQASPAFERLRVHALTGRYGIGATAIREALSRLVADGYVEAEDQRGFCVARVPQGELLDLARTRADVEGMALRSAIAEGGLEWVESEAGLLSSFHRLSKTPVTASPKLLSAHRWATTEIILTAVFGADGNEGISRRRAANLTDPP